MHSEHYTERADALEELFNDSYTHTDPLSGIDSSFVFDFTAYDDYWGEHNNIVRKTPEGMLVEPRLVAKSESLAELVEARKEAERT